MANQRLSAGSLSRLLLISCASACSADVVDLGRGDMSPLVERGPLCPAFPYVAGSTYVTNQGELEALRGCEQIQGDLVVDVFAGADTSPLASLRAIDGSLVLGAYPVSLPGSTYSYPADIPLDVLVADIIEQGYLTSLHGLEALERVGAFYLRGVGVADLSELESLGAVGTQLDGLSTGLVEIYDAPNLTSLTGFENVINLTQLLLGGNTALQSLSGLVVNSNTGVVSIDGSPELRSLAELAPISYLAGLGLSNVGIRNLDDLVNLGQVVDLTLMSNPELENVDRLGSLTTIESLTLSRNPKLASIPALPDLSGELRYVFIDSNPELRSVSLGLPPSATSYVSRGRPIDSSVGFFEIRGNSKLETLSLAAGLEKADYLNVDGNSSLTSIDFGSLRSLDRLALEDNPALTTLVLGNLQSVDALWVTDNPLLSTAALGNVLTFERVLRGNADDGAQPAAADAAPLP
jgi:hypothetical protein